MKSYIPILLLMSLAVFSNAQVGIETEDPQNDLHVNGGVRIDDLPAGTGDDAGLRLLAATVNADIVTGSIKNALAGGNFPIQQVAYNAIYGSAAANEAPLFQSCSSCSSGQTLNMQLRTNGINISKPELVTVNLGGSALGDEFFQITQAGIYGFHVQTAIAVPNC